MPLWPLQYATSSETHERAAQSPEYVYKLDIVLFKVLNPTIIGIECLFYPIRRVQGFVRRSTDTVKPSQGMLPSPELSHANGRKVDPSTKRIMDYRRRQDLLRA